MVFPTPQAMAYDRATTIFSPEGDLYQVRYAFEAVKKGWTSVGIRSIHGVVLGAEKRKISPLLDIVNIEKIYKIDDHIAVAFAGMGSDGRILIDVARQLALRHRLIYGEEATVDLLAKYIADIKQAYTQHGGVRPFGVALLFGGVNPDGSVRLFRTDPGGQYFSYNAVAIGSGDAYVNSFFEKIYREDLTIDEMIRIVIEALFKSRIATGEERKEVLIEEFHQLVEVGYIDVKTRRFRKLSVEELKDLIGKMRSQLLESK